MKNRLFTNGFEYLLWFLSILFFVIGISSGIPKTAVTFSAISIAFVIVNIWIKNNLSRISYDQRWIYITKARKEIRLPLEKKEWISELPGGGIGICFMGFRGSTIFGEKIVFARNTYTQPVRDLIKTAEAKGHKIEHFRAW
jgi:hypothetical protein